MTDQTELDMNAAEAQAALYDDDDRECIKTDVMNSFYAGIAYAREQSAAEKLTTTFPTH